MHQFTCVCCLPSPPCSVAFYAGSRFIAEGWLDFPALIKTFLAITLAAESVGRIASQSPDTAKASAAANAIFALVDSGEASPIDPLKETGKKAAELTTAAAAKTVSATSTVSLSSGRRIEFRNVTFAYPARPDIPVLRNFSLIIEPGQYIGICGRSGSGKSTITLLILRYYDPQAGLVRAQLQRVGATAGFSARGPQRRCDAADFALQVLVDGVDVRDWNLRELRAQMGLVQQEPALFADSVRCHR